jgi:dihydropteroate synthase
LAGLATTVEVNQKLAEKQNALTAGNGITIINDVISTNLDTAAFEIVT